MTQNIETCIERNSIRSGCAVKWLISNLLIDVLVSHCSRSGVGQIVAVRGLSVVKTALALTIGSTVRIKWSTTKTASTSIS